MNDNQTKEYIQFLEEIIMIFHQKQLYEEMLQKNKEEQQELKKRILQLQISLKRNLMKMERFENLVLEEDSAIKWQK